MGCSASTNRAWAQPQALANLGSKQLLVHKTPSPTLAFFQALDDGVTGVLKVLAGMFVLGIITAAYVTTGHANPEVNPGIA